MRYLSLNASCQHSHVLALPGNAMSWRLRLLCPKTARFLWSIVLFFIILACVPLAHAVDLLTLDNGSVKVGIDREKGASITWLSWSDYPKNMVNVADPGRLIQQSYYAGKSLDRNADGQSKAWSPWTWNPIQGGGISSWARVNEFKRLGTDSLFAETIPNILSNFTSFAPTLAANWSNIVFSYRLTSACF